MNKEEFEYAKEIKILERENLELEHKLKIERLEYERESNKRFHESELERLRIKSAEIRKSQMRREQGGAFHR